MSLCLSKTSLHFAMLGALLVLTACQRSAPKKEESIFDAPAVEIYTPSEGAVGFQILSAGDADATMRWLAIYSDVSGRTTKFRIELGADKGRFISEEGSDPIPMLEALQTALKVKQLPANVQKAEFVPFDFEMVGDAATRSENGTLTKRSGGNWVAMKIILGSRKTTMFFNFNPSMHQAEFAIADPKGGDAILAELAKIL